MNAGEETNRSQRKELLMDDQELRNLLEQLHGEIERTESSDVKGRELLAHLRDDVNDLLKHPAGEVVQPRPTAIGRLEDSIDHFEVSHPTLTAMLSKLLATLSNAGI
jgi:hypothetical protein